MISQVQGRLRNDRNVSGRHFHQTVHGEHRWLHRAAAAQHKVVGGGGDGGDDMSVQDEGD